MALASIVVGTDGSPASWRALAVAVGIARLEGSCLHACFVAHTPAAADIASVAVPVAPSVIADDGADLGREVIEELARAGVRGDFACRTGDVARELEALATATSADLIVVGHSRHPALHLGGAPRRLLATGYWPVLVVP